MSQSSSNLQVIADIEQEIIAIVGRAVTCEKACKIGDLLAQAKASLPHGQYMGWIENELPKVADISYQTANKYSAVRDWLQPEQMLMARELLNNSLFSHVYPLYIGIKGTEKGADNEVESLSARSQSLLHLYSRNQSHLTVNLVERLVKVYKKQPQLFDKISLIDGDEEILREILNRSSSDKFLQALDEYLSDDLHLTRTHLLQIDANLDVVEPKGDRAVTSCASCTFFASQGALPGQASMIGRCNKFHKELNLSELDHGLNCEKWVRRDDNVEATTEKVEKVEKLEREEPEEIETVEPSTKAMGAALVQRKEGETLAVDVRNRLHRNIEKYVVTGKTQLVAEAEKLGICELIALAVLYRANLEGCELTISEVKKRIQNIQWINVNQ
jgi:hypothetical protein